MTELTYKPGDRVRTRHADDDTIHPIVHGGTVVRTWPSGAHPGAVCVSVQSDVYRYAWTIAYYADELERLDA